MIIWLKKMYKGNLRKLEILVENLTIMTFENFNNIKKIIVNVYKNVVRKEHLMIKIQGTTS